MLGTAAFSDGKTIHETAGCDRSLNQKDRGEPGSDVVIQQRSDCETETNTCTITNEELVPSGSISTSSWVQQQRRSPSLEATNSSYSASTEQGDDKTRWRNADNELQRSGQAIQIRPALERETSILAKNFVEDRVIGPIPAIGYLGPAATNVGSPQSNCSPPRSETLESGSFISIKNRPQEVAPAYPTEIDVIFGRGEPTRKHPGNVIFREHVNKWLDEYMKGSKTTKSSIIRRVIDDVASSGARYLVPLNATCRLTIFTAGCREARKSEIRSKVSHAFRDGERRILQQQRGKEGTLEVVSHGKQQNDDATNTSAMAIGGATVQRTQDVATVLGSKPLAAICFVPSDFTGPELLRSSKGQSVKHKNSVSSARGMANQADSISPSLSMSAQDFETDRPTNDPAATSTDLLSFANILTSLRRNSRPQSPRGDGRDQPHAPITSAPNDHATVSDKYKKQQLREIQSKKDTTKNSSPIVQSLEKFCRECDIVFGRGAPLRQHPGNIRFRRIVSKYNKKYGDASKHEKTLIIQNVIRELQSEGAKFLMMDDSSGVTEASPDEIRMKVSHRFRDFTKGKGNSINSKTKENNKKTASGPMVTPSALSNGGEVLIEV